MISRAGMALKALMVIVSALVVGTATMASAQASTTSGSVFKVERKAAQTAKTNSPSGAQAVYFCYPPFRYTNGAAWNCTVNSGAIQFWITCTVGGTYYSGYYYPGTYYVSATCPQGLRVSEGVREVA